MSFENYPDTQRRREVIRESYEKAKASGDNNVYFIDGETLYGDRDRKICTVDGVHPNELGFYRIAEGIYKVYGSIDEKFVL
ncbi:MAG: hypothetical protein IKV88_09420 [Clostridia bacterium]|nr:hypothetical protein [Clostridia bacterium]